MTGNRKTFGVTVGTYLVVQEICPHGDSPQHIEELLPRPAHAIAHDLAAPHLQQAVVVRTCPKHLNLKAEDYVCTKVDVIGVDNEKL